MVQYDEGTSNSAAAQSAAAQKAAEAAAKLKEWKEARASSKTGKEVAVSAEAVGVS